MALLKKIKQKNGLELSYHRIALINVDVHNQVTVMVYSYIDQNARQLEKEILESKEDRMTEMPYMFAQYYTFDYTKHPELYAGNVLEKAYGVLKSMEEYAGAEDILERGQTLSE